LKQEFAETDVVKKFLTGNLKNDIIRNFPYAFRSWREPFQLPAGDIHTKYFLLKAIRAFAESYVDFAAALSHLAGAGQAVAAG
jgi:hypothetical protein